MSPVGSDPERPPLPTPRGVIASGWHRSRSFWTIRSAVISLPMLRGRQVLTPCPSSGQASRLMQYANYADSARGQAVVNIVWVAY